MHALAPPLWQDIGIASIGANLLAQEENTRWAAQETQVSEFAHCLQLFHFYETRRESQRGQHLPYKHSTMNLFRKTVYRNFQS